MARPTDSGMFVRPDTLGAGDLARALEAAENVRQVPATVAHRVFHDSFDWRLYRRGQVLEALPDGAGPRLLWRDLRGPGLGHLDSPVPRFVWDLPRGPLRRRLAPVLEMRALLPVVRVETTSERFDILNEDGKTVCRVFLEDHRAGSPEGPVSQPLPPSVRVEPVRGYGKDWKAVRGILCRELSLKPAEGDVLDAALASLGRVAADYSSKVRVALTPGMSAAEAMRVILLDLFSTMEANEEGARADLDSEFLHDFRVAVRRTRSALGQVKGVLPKAHLKRFIPEFRWLGSLTGPTRDLDVYLLQMPAYLRLLPPDRRRDLDPLATFLRARQRDEQRKLARGLSSRRYRNLTEEWRAFLAAPWPPSEDAPHGTASVRSVANARIRKAFEKVLREGLAFDATSPAEALHELRKTCKKLRYLMEFFQSLYPATEVAKFVKLLKGLQDNLGEFQDLYVHAGSLPEFATEMEAAGTGSARAHLAMGMLVERFAHRAVEVRAEFAERFRAFSDTRNRRRFEALFGRAGKTREIPS